MSYSGGLHIKRLVPMGYFIFTTMKTSKEEKISVTSFVFGEWRLEGLMSEVIRFFLHICRQLSRLFHPRESQLEKCSPLPETPSFVILSLRRISPYSVVFAAAKRDPSQAQDDEIAVLPHRTGLLNQSGEGHSEEFFRSRRTICLSSRLLHHFPQGKRKIRL